MYSSVKFLSPMRHRRLAGARLAARRGRACLLLLLLLPQAASTTASARATAAATPCIALLCTYPPSSDFRLTVMSEKLSSLGAGHRTAGHERAAAPSSGGGASDTSAAGAGRAA